MRVATVLELAERNGVPVPSGLTETGWRFSGPGDFIEQYIAVCGLMTRLEDFQRLGREVGEDLAATGVRYAEAVFTPSAHAATIGETGSGRSRHCWTASPPASATTGTRCGSRPTWCATSGWTRRRARSRSRGSSPAAAWSRSTARAASVAAIAPFATCSAAPGTPACDSVPHAGEWAGPENVWETLEHYAPDRIGHGVRAIDDPQLVETLAERRIPLEVCATSNVRHRRLPLARGTIRSCGCATPAWW